MNKKYPNRIGLKRRFRNRNMKSRFKEEVIKCAKILVIIFVLITIWGSCDKTEYPTTVEMTCTECLNTYYISQEDYDNFNDNFLCKECTYIKGHNDLVEELKLVISGAEDGKCISLDAISSVLFKMYDDTTADNVIDQMVETDGGSVRTFDFDYIDEVPDDWDK